MGCNLNGVWFNCIKHNRKNVNRKLLEITNDQSTYFYHDRFISYSVYPIKYAHGYTLCFILLSWWRHQMETFSALLAICAGNSPVTGDFPSQRPVMRSFDVFFDLHPNKRLSKQSWCWWFETHSRSLWRHCNGLFWPSYSHDHILSYDSIHWVWLTQWQWSNPEMIWVKSTVPNHGAILEYTAFVIFDCTRTLQWRHMGDI